MEKKSFVLTQLFLLITAIAGAQVFNWKNLQKHEKHIASVHAGAEYGLNYGISYGYKLRTGKPVILNAEFSIPSGKEIFDDYKIKTGGQILWLQDGYFNFSSKFQGLFRRYNNSYARLLNFGADISVTSGYYKRRWFVAGELGFDKAIVTHFKHTDAYKANFPAVQDGWYEPPTGRNIYYGVQAGWSVRKSDIYIRFGKLSQQDFKSSPMLPVYAELGFSLRLIAK